MMLHVQGKTLYRYLRIGIYACTLDVEEIEQLAVRQ